MKALTVLSFPLDAMNLCIKPLGGFIFGDCNLGLVWLVGVILMFGAESFLLSATGAPGDRRVGLGEVEADCDH